MRKVKDGVTKTVHRSKAKDLRSRDPVFPNNDHEDASLFPNIEVQDASGAKHGSDPQSALREAEEAVKGMDLLRGMWDLEYPPPKLLQRISRAHTFSTAHIFNPSGCSTTLLGSLLMHGPIPLSLNRVNFVPQVHPCAKIALGVSSCASKYRWTSPNQIATKQYTVSSTSGIKFMASWYRTIRSARFNQCAFSDRSLSRLLDAPASSEIIQKPRASGRD
ncbi:hypothetical protein CY34DRAFT_136381 [Suillus luteus UH-Slu-Lm8-n1]|uniref:Uncharacterized protein n=1 Tax=Suillus luteus UH-Slu-Lm8-n1 TaxID=930992 RepID=A0A0C9ZXZ8_9AGAM|nr:hypothetical protein CY34DRAFT_136381 [Suillus luteus UH-Slu-Lm8-n1]